MFAIPARLPRLARRVALGTVVLAVPLDARAQDADAKALDKLLGPIALYPDPLLAQVLTASTSPEQVKEFNTWLKGQSLTGSELQQAATDEGFEASFASLALFPEVVSTLASNMDWTKELGTAYLSDAKGVMASVQRLRDQAHDVGNLKTNDQQTVTVENTGGSQTVVIQPANPQVVYVPSYDPQVVYTQPPPPPSSGNAVMAGLIGFGIGIAIGAAIDNDPYYYGPHGWGAWGMGWGGGAVVYSRSVWVVPARPRYPYVRPVPGYRPRTNVVAPRRTNVNINVDNSRTNINVGNKVNTGDRNSNNRNTNNRNANVSKGDVNRTPNASNRAGTTKTGATNRATATGASNRSTDRTPATANRTSSASTNKAHAPDRGHTASATRTAPKASKSAMSGYSNGSNTKSASSRGKSSVSKSKAGGGHKR